ncbi:MAG: D-alanine--D-alanine ligase [Alphaproteobacteria bacterium BRH_c36]|nr:MAG: D-alanine--D-alanine ligase [Alphaproteobacteria bacterium BRH_c36]
MSTIGTSPPRTKANVAVLLGGWSAEREISLRSGEAVAKALEGEGYAVTRIDVGRDIAVLLSDLKPEACFNALHGEFGEDGCIQGVLECLEIPYTHSGVLASALAMHKERAKDVLRQAKVPVAEAKLVTRAQAAAGHILAPPYVVKPVAEGSSVGVAIVREGDRPLASIAAGGPSEQLVMVERYVAGRELTCAVIGDFVTAITEILPAEGMPFYDFDAKYAPGGSRHQLPAVLSPDVNQLIRKYTLAAHRALGCRGVSRADFRFDDTLGGTGELVCLEVNTQPGMTATSLVPELAAEAGWSFGELVRWIVEDASCKR